MNTKLILHAMAAYVEELERVRNHAALLAEGALAVPGLNADAKMLQERIRRANHARRELDS